MSRASAASAPARSRRVGRRTEARRRHAGLPGRMPTRIQAREEHRRAGAGQSAGDREYSRIACRSRPNWRSATRSIGVTADGGDRARFGQAQTGDRRDGRHSADDRRSSSTTSCVDRAGRSGLKRARLELLKRLERLRVAVRRYLGDCLARPDQKLGPRIAERPIVDIPFMTKPYGADIGWRRS